MGKILRLRNAIGLGAVLILSLILIVLFGQIAGRDSDLAHVTPFNELPFLLDLPLYGKLEPIKTEEIARGVSMPFYVTNTNYYRDGTVELQVKKGICEISNLQFSTVSPPEKVKVYIKFLEGKQLLFSFTSYEHLKKGIIEDLSQIRILDPSGLPQSEQALGESITLDEFLGCEGCYRGKEVDIEVSVISAGVLSNGDLFLIAHSTCGPISLTIRLSEQATESDSFLNGVRNQVVRIQSAYLATPTTWHVQNIDDLEVLGAVED